VQLVSVRIHFNMLSKIALINALISAVSAGTSLKATRTGMRMLRL